MAVSAKKVVFTSFAVDLFDVVSSIVVAFLSGSIVMVAQGLEGGADLISSGLLIFGLKRSLRRSDADHPFGHGREVYFWTLISALFTLSISAGLSFYFGWQRFLHPHTVNDLFLAYLVLVITTGTNGYSLILSIRRLVGKKLHLIGYAFLNSPLIETRATFVLDLMGTSASLIGLIALVLYGFSGDLRFDGLGAMAIGITLAVMAFVLILGVKDLLVGKSATLEIEESIRKVTLSVAGVKDVFGLRTNYIGPDQILVELDIHLENDLVTDQIEDIIEKVKQKVRSAVKEVSFIQVEVK